MPSVKQELVLQAKFRDRAGNPSDPNTVSSWVKDPAGAVSVVVVSATALVGTWEGLYTPAKEGEHIWLLESLGNPKTSFEKKFVVVPREVIHSP